MIIVKLAIGEICCVKHKIECAGKIHHFDTPVKLLLKDDEDNVTGSVVRHYHLKLIGCPRCDDEYRETARLERNKIINQQEEQRKSYFISKAKEQSGIPEKYSHASIKNFDITPRPKELEVILSQYQNYVANLKHNVSTGVNLLAVGKRGRGKSHLAVSVMKLAVELGFTVRFDELSAIVTKCANSYDNRCIYAQYDLLVIDDLVEVEWLKEKNVIFNLIGDRYNNRKSTIINTHLPSSQTSKIFDETRKDRLLENAVVVDFDKPFDLYDTYSYRAWIKSQQLKNQSCGTDLRVAHDN